MSDLSLGGGSIREPAAIVQKINHASSEGGVGKVNGDMYVTLNSAAQHSPDTVWTLPSDQTLDDTPLLTSKEVDAVVDGIEQAAMPFDNVDDSHAEEKIKEKEANIAKEAAALSTTLIQPWQLEVQGLPWQTRQPVYMKNLTEAWKRNGMCPHPHCPNGASTKQSNPTANPLIYHHWYTLHMAPGYCKIFTCELCSTVLKTKPALKTHLMKAHNFADSNASALVRRIEMKWEHLVDGKKDPTAGLPWKVCDSTSLQQLISSWKANKYTCPHHACKSRIYRPWQAVLHWYHDHMAPGYSQIYPCVLCGKPFMLVEFLRTHLSVEHDLMQDIIDGMVEKLSANWAKMIELKTPLTDAVVAAHLKERATNKPIPPMKLVEASGMPWKIWCLETSRAVIAAWLLDDRGRCPHPSCNDRFKSETDVMLHWQDIHMAPDFGITYPCQHGVGSQYACTKVFINRHDVIIHSRNEHGYSDWVIEAMLRNIEAVSQKKLMIANGEAPPPAAAPPQPAQPPPSSQSQQSNSETDSGIASGENQTMSPPTPTEPANTCTTTTTITTTAAAAAAAAAAVTAAATATAAAAAIAAAAPPSIIEVEDIKSNLIYRCQHGLGSHFPCTMSFLTKEDLIDHAKNVHGYNDFVVNAMIRIVEKSNYKESENNHLMNGHVRSSPLPPAATIVQEEEVEESQPAAEILVPEPVTKSFVMPAVDKQDLQSLLWKAIVSAWNNNKKCPHPKCAMSELNLYPEYGQMLGHWMRHHIDYSLGERTFYPCLHGQESHDLCMRVFTSAIDLKMHSVHEHHYGSDEIDVFLATLESHVDNLISEYSENEIAQNAAAIPNATTEKVQTIREDYHDDTAAPLYKRRRFSEDSMG